MARHMFASSISSLLMLFSSSVSAQEAPDMPNPASNDPHPFIGMWVTADGNIRQELRTDGRYDEARGNRQSAYQGRYEISGSHIDYWDDTGFTADGYFEDGILYHAGMIMYRQPLQ